MAKDPQEVLTEALVELGFKHVVYIDDAFDRDPVDKELLNAWLQIEANRIKVQDVLSKQLGCPDPNDEFFPASFRQFADDLENQQKVLAIQHRVDREIDLEFAEDADGNDLEEHRRLATDRIILTTFSQIMTGVRGVTFYPIGLQEWNRQKHILVNRAISERTLFVFDQELSERQDGTTEIGAIQQQLAGSEAVYILLSYKVEQNLENDQTRALQKAGVPATAIPKRELKSTIVDGKLSLRIKAAILSKEADPIHKEFRRAMRASSKSVSNRVAMLTGLEFDELVMRSSAQEGIHELDTLIRIYTNGFAAELRKILRTKKSVHDAIQKARNFSLNPKGAPLNIGDVGWRLYREELYEPGDYINSCHSPIEAGDIFQLNSQGGQMLGKFVLIAQPCDMMVRKNGLRKANELLLAEIKMVQSEDVLKAKKSFELPYFDESTGSKWWIDFSNIFTIDGRFLDLCSLQANGIARMPLTRVPMNLSPSWNKRWETVLSEFVQDIIASLELSESQTPEERCVGDILPKHVVLLNGHERLKISLERRGRRKFVEFGIARTQRLNHTLTSEMLRAFGDYLSRPARPHPLTVSKG